LHLIRSAASTRGRLAGAAETEAQRGRRPGPPPSRGGHSCRPRGGGSGGVLAALRSPPPDPPPRGRRPATSQVHQSTRD